MNRALFVINVIAHYQVPLFSRISELRGGQIHVVSVRDIPKYRKRMGWSSDSEAFSFSYEVLAEREWSFFSRRLLFSKGIVSALLTAEFDVVVIGGYYTLTAWLTLLLCKAMGRKVVLRSGTHRYCEGNSDYGTRLLKRLFIKLCDGYVAYGTYAKEYLVELGAPSEKVNIEYDTVDVKQLLRRYKTECEQREDVREYWKRKLGFEGKTALYVGELIPRKNVQTIINAFDILQNKSPELTLVIVGSGELNSELRGIVQQRGLTNVQFVGSIAHKEVAEYYMATDVFLIMSVSDPYPLVVNEAMSFGCPVVVSKNCGNSVDLVSENGAVIDDPFDFESLASAIECILSDEEDRRKMSELSATIIACYDIDRAANSINSSIDNALTPS